MTLTIKIWDVLHGLGIYINTPNNKHIIIDAGVNEGGFSPIYHLNKKYGVKKIDWAIITHPHKDHIDEIKNISFLEPEVLSRPQQITRKNFDWKEIKEQDRDIFEEYFNLSEKYSQSVNPLNGPISENNLGGVNIKTFIPQNCPIENLNNQSIVTILTYSGSKILIPGDNELISWKELLSREDFLEAVNGTDILIAPHHGRESGYCKELFEKINPKLIVISDSPKTDTSATSRYSNHAIGWKVHSRSGQEIKERFVLSTRLDGMIEIKSYSQNGQNYLIVYKN